MAVPDPMTTDYESERLLNEYLLFHYGEADRVLPWAGGPRDALDFPGRCVRFALGQIELPEGAEALDLGCAVGRSTFELAKSCRRVVGIDFSKAFIGAAQRLASGEAVPYAVKETGDWHEPAVARVEDGLPTGRASFEVGDAQALRPDLGSFDLVLACNLLCRLGKPARLLQRLPALVKPGGYLLLTTPHTWLEEFTAKSGWIGGRHRGDDSLRALKAALAPSFGLQAHEDLPFLIREHRRKYQWSVAEASLWRREPHR